MLRMYLSYARITEECAFAEFYRYAHICSLCLWLQNQHYRNTFPDIDTPQNRVVWTSRSSIPIRFPGSQDLRTQRRNIYGSKLERNTNVGILHQNPEVSAAHALPLDLVTRAKHVTELSTLLAVSMKACTNVHVHDHDCTRLHLWAYILSFICL